VFPEFYGSYWKSCAENLWAEINVVTLKDGTHVKQHLSSYGILTLEHYQEHIKKVEKKFWDRFVGVREWQKSIESFYDRRGFVEMKFGHRRSGYLGRNKIINSPIQGSAFHCLLWSLIELNKIRKKDKWRTKIIGQIHDNIVDDLFPEEESHVLETSERVTCRDIREQHDWIIVPLEVEFEITEIDGSWYTKKPLTFQKKKV
jgi:DNA polymerase I-like protein with 3'-5' exonuclease and polymerase domains